MTRTETELDDGQPYKLQFSAKDSGLKPAFPGAMSQGLSKREYMATAIIQGLLSSPARPKFEHGTNNHVIGVMAQFAVTIADELLEKLAKS